MVSNVLAFTSVSAALQKDYGRIPKSGRFSVLSSQNLHLKLVLFPVLLYISWKLSLYISSSRMVVVWNLVKFEAKSGFPFVFLAFKLLDH